MHAPGLLSLALAASAGWIGATIVHTAQDPAKEPVLQDTAGQMPVVKPGKHHKLLAAEAGEWSYVNKMWMGPGDPILSKGVEKNQIACDGLWMITSVSGDMMGRKFEAYACTGYDSSKKKYVGAWLDNFGDMLVLSEGTCSEDGKTREMWMKMPGMDGKPADWKLVHVVKDENNRHLEMFTKAPGGKLHKHMEISYSRK